MKWIRFFAVFVLTAGSAMAQSSSTPEEAASDIQTRIERQKMDTNAGGYKAGPCATSNGSAYLSLRCYFDSAGQWHHTVYEQDGVSQAGEDVYGRWVKPSPWKKVVVCFASVRDRQQAYNDWIASLGFVTESDGELCVGAKFQGQSCEQTIPAALPAFGALTLNTLLIPYYRSIAERSVLSDHWTHDCAKELPPDGDAGRDFRGCMRDFADLSASLQLRYRAIQEELSAQDAYKIQVDKLRGLAQGIDYSVLPFYGRPGTIVTVQKDDAYIDVEAIPQDVSSKLNDGEGRIARAIGVVLSLEQDYASAHAPNRQ
jgi:hypothetical protein